MTEFIGKILKLGKNVLKGSLFTALLLSISQPATAQAPDSKIYLPLTSTSCNSQFSYPELTGSLNCFNESLYDSNLFLVSNTTGAAYAIYIDNFNTRTYLYISDPIPSSEVTEYVFTGQPSVSYVTILRFSENLDDSFSYDTIWIPRSINPVSLDGAINQEFTGLTGFQYVIASQLTQDDINNHTTPEETKVILQGLLGVR